MLGALIFDLDDTLLDTSRLLVPQAERESCLAMIQAGLNSDLETCLAKRKELIARNLRTQAFEWIVRELGTRGQADPKAVSAAGHRAFYERKVESSIRLESEVLNLLERLKAKYELYLVTAGSASTQKQKVEILKIESYFRKLFYVELSKGETKEQAFREVSNLSQVSNSSILSIGDRIDTDIAGAKALGMKACLVAKGEYARLKPLNSLEEPDFKVKQVTEIESVCRL